MRMKHEIHAVLFASALSSTAAEASSSLFVSNGSGSSPLSAPSTRIATFKLSFASIVTGMDHVKSSSRAS